MKRPPSPSLEWTNAKSSTRTFGSKCSMTWAEKMASSEGSGCWRRYSTASHSLTRNPGRVASRDQFRVELDADGVDAFAGQKL